LKSAFGIRAGSELNRQNTSSRQFIDPFAIEFSGIAVKGKQHIAGIGQV
jgi:hypothetical protein